MYLSSDLHFQDKVVHAKDFIYIQGKCDEDLGKDKLWQDHLEKMRNPGEWAGDVEVEFMHRMLKRTIVVVMSSGEDDPDLNIKGRDDGDRTQQILLGHIYENHYVSLDTATEKSK